MQFSDEPAFDHRDRRDIYEYIERYGVVDPEDARRSLDMSQEAFGHHVAALRRESVVDRTEDGDLRIAFEDDDEETFQLANGTEVTIRQARQDDLTSLIGAIRAALSGDTYIVGETVADVVDHENVLLRSNELESRVFFVATIRDDIVGWVHVDAPKQSKLSHTAELTVGVLPSHRDEGIGSRLHDRGVEWAEEHGLKKLYNSVPSTNEAAIEFLEGRGWEVEAVREDHYQIDDEHVDEVMLAKYLDSL